MEAILSRASLCSNYKEVCGIRKVFLRAAFDRNIYYLSLKGNLLIAVWQGNKYSVLHVTKRIND